jgi:hypothetical protein
MINILKVLPFLVPLFLCACVPTQRSLIAEQALCIPIGLDEEAVDLCVLNVNQGNPTYQYCTYYLVSEEGIANVEGLGGFQTYEMLTSPSRKYVVISEDAGEGHPYFTVLSLEDIRNGNKPGVIESIEAYPSGFYGLEWQGDKLLFNTETDLLASREIRNETDWLYEFAYRLDAETGEVVQLGEPIPLNN